MMKLYSLLWGQYTDTLKQVLCILEHFDENDIKFDAKWILRQIKLTTHSIKEGKHSNSYDSVYKLIRKFFSFNKPRMNHATNF